MQFNLFVNIWLAAIILLTLVHALERSVMRNAFVDPPEAGSASKPRSYSDGNKIPIKFITEWDEVSLGISQRRGEDLMPAPSIHWSPKPDKIKNGKLVGDWHFLLDSSTLRPPVLFDLTLGKSRRDAHRRKTMSVD